MSELAFAHDWLDLREPADHAARDAGLLAQALRGLSPGDVILDLGSGTGSTARAVAGCEAEAGLSGAFRWRFFDADAGLLEIARQRHPGSEVILGGLADPEALPLEGVALVTSSALLDLMPERWIEALARRLGRAGLPFYAALSYNGEMSWAPELPEDCAITAAFNRHQQGDKGLGPAMGPRAAAAARAAFERQGYRVTTAESPWVLGPDAAALHADLLEGIASAAGEAGQGASARWLAARRAMLGGATARIGHTDILAMRP